MKIEEIPKWNRPRERAKRLGISKLDDRELLAIIIGSGKPNKNALEIADDLLNSFHTLRNMVGMEAKTFEKFYGISEVKALTFAAIFEIQRRVLLEESSEGYQSAEKIFENYSKRIINLSSEDLFIIYYNRGGRFIKESIFRANLEANVTVSVNSIIRECISLNAKKIVMVHNHPSGNVTPSVGDIRSTEMFEAKLKEFGITVIDHIIVTEKAYYSLRKRESGPKIFL